MKMMCFPRKAMAASSLLFCAMSVPALANPVTNHPYGDVTIGNVHITDITLHIETATGPSPPTETSKHFSVTCGAESTIPLNGTTQVSIHYNLLDAKGRLIDIVFNDNVILVPGIAICNADNTNWVVTDEDPIIVQAQVKVTHIQDYAPVTLRPTQKTP